MNWEAEFYRKYQAPKTENVTVGFTGIDPGNYNDDLTSEQRDIVEDMILSYLKRLQIRVDSGNVDPSIIENPLYIDLETERLTHNKLGGLQGGKPNDCYHLTAQEWGKLLRMLNVVYPDGATDPVFPGGGGGGDDTGGGDDGDTTGGLPGSTPPLWTQNNLPADYTFYSADMPDPHVHKPYYGVLGAVMNWYYGLALAKYKEGQSGEKVHILKYTSLGWSKYCNAYYTANTSHADQHFDWISQWFYYNGVLYVLGNHYAPTRFLHYINSSGDMKREMYSSVEDGLNSCPFTTGVYSDNLNQLFFFNVEGSYIRCTTDRDLVVKKELLSVGMRITAGCAAYNPINNLICVAGKQGTANSANGTSWVTNTNAPKDIMYLTYREDLGRFFAFGYESKLFYSSTDGLNWTNFNNTPVPISSVSSVNYNPDLGWYCAVGGTSKNAYFSKDLKTWRTVEVTQGTPIKMGNVVWVSGEVTKSYLLIPQNGSQYYTFNPSDWK